MYSKDELKRLRGLFYEAREAAAQLRGDQSSERSTLLKEATQRIDQELSIKYAEKLKLADQNQAVKDAQYLTYLENYRAQEDVAGIPLGTEFHEWGRKPHQYSPRNAPYELTGKVGILEVFTRTSAFPANLSDYSIPEIGSYILRFKKKNGSLSTQFMVLGYCDIKKRVVIPNHWCLDGVDYGEIHQKEAGRNRLISDEVLVLTKDLSHRVSEGNWCIAAGSSERSWWIDQFLVLIIPATGDFYLSAKPIGFRFPSREHIEELIKKYPIALQGVVAQQVEES